MERPAAAFHFESGGWGGQHPCRSPRFDAPLLIRLITSHIVNQIVRERVCVRVCASLWCVCVCVCVCLSVCVRVCFLLFVANRPFVRNCVRFHDVSGAQESTAERASSKQVQQVWRLCVCVCSCVCVCVSVRACLHSSALPGAPGLNGTRG